MLSRTAQQHALAQDPTPRVERRRHLQRFANLFKQRSKERMVQDVELPANKTKTEPPPVEPPCNNEPTNDSSYHEALVDLSGAISVLAARAVHGFNKLWRVEQRIVRVFGLAVLSTRVQSAVWHDARVTAASRWEEIVATVGFVDWPDISDKSSLSALCRSTPIAVEVTSTVVMLWSLFTRNPGNARLSVLVLALSTAMIYVAIMSSLDTIPMDEIVESLSVQADAVENFNRRYCHAWCRHSAFGLAAFTRGDCGPKDLTVFDRIVTSPLKWGISPIEFDIKD